MNPAETASTTDSWPTGSATGVGSWPGTSALEAARTVFGELPDFPHLVELPDRGPWADMVGRATALLVDLPADHDGTAWRLSARPTRESRRAGSFMVEDLDRLEEAGEGWAGPLKLQVCGPVTLAAALELARGDYVLGDRSARQDLVASLAEGAAQHVADVRRRLPGCAMFVQVDEPALPAALAGEIATITGFGRVRALDPVHAQGLLHTLADAITAAGAVPIAHCCATDVPVDLLASAGFHALSLDLAVLDPARDDELADVLDRGRATSSPTGSATGPVRLLAGVVSAATSSPGDSDVGVPSLRERLDRVGVSTAQALERVVVTPTCGLAGFSREQALAAYREARGMARVLANEGRR